MQFEHCNIGGYLYDPVVGHLLLPDAMPTLNAVHLLPRRISNQAHCHLLPAVGFFFVRGAIRATTNTPSPQRINAAA
jgi:hypothetical protein